MQHRGTSHPASEGAGAPRRRARRTSSAEAGEQAALRRTRLRQGPLPLRAWAAQAPSGQGAAAAGPRPGAGGLRIRPALMAAAIMVALATASALIGIGAAYLIADYLDGAQGTAGSRSTQVSTPSSEWQEGDLPHLYQTDPQWADRPFGTGTIGTDGTALLCLAMVRIEATGDVSAGPAEVAGMVQQAGLADVAHGSTMLQDGAAALGLVATPVEPRESPMRRQLIAGNPIVCVVSSVAFGTEPTYIVLEDIDEYGQLVICDPLSCERTQKHWTFEEIIGSSTAMWAYAQAAG